MYWIKKKLLESNCYLCVEIDDLIFVEGIEKGIRKFKNNKVVGFDRICNEMFKIIVRFIKFLFVKFFIVLY